MNTVVISGILPEAPKKLGGEKGPVVMRVSVGERRKDKESGEFKTFWNSLDVVVWGPDREHCLNLKEGSNVVVTGSLRRESYENKEGTKVWQTRIKADTVNLAISDDTTDQQEMELAGATEEKSTW